MLYDADATGDMLLLYRNSLHNIPYRQKLKLPAIRVGKRLMFHSDDIERVIREGRERFDAEPEEGNS